MSGASMASGRRLAAPRVLRRRLGVVLAGNDDVRPHRPELYQVQPAGVELLQLLDGGPERRVDVRLITGGRFARRGDHLRLVSVRVHVGQVVINHIPRLRLNGRFRLQVGVP